MHFSEISGTHGTEYEDIVMTCNLVGTKVSEKLSTHIFLFKKNAAGKFETTIRLLQTVPHPILNYGKFHTKSLLEDQIVHDI